ncbi:hypothetical protein MTO96_037468 [Rhipicephalus appendiculatus]
MTTSMPTHHVCDTRPGATCHLFSDTAGGTLTVPAAISHVNAYDQYAAPLTRSTVPAGHGSSVATYAPSLDLAQPKPPANPDLPLNISGDSAEELKTDQHSPHDIHRRSGSHECCSS